jgi:hypothetical protein
MKEQNNTTTQTNAIIVIAITNINAAICHTNNISKHNGNAGIF